MWKLRWPMKFMVVIETKISNNTENETFLFIFDSPVFSRSWFVSMVSEHGYSHIAFLQGKTWWIERAKFSRYELRGKYGVC